MTKHEEVAEVTACDLRIKRIVAAWRMMFRFIEKADDKDRDLYALNLCRDLTEDDRVRILELILDTFPPDMAESVCMEWFRGAGYPGAGLMDSPVADARFWAQQANSKEIDAYAMACVHRMSPQRRRQFSAWIQKQLEKKGDPAS